MEQVSNLSGLHMPAEELAGELKEQEWEGFRLLLSVGRLLHVHDIRTLLAMPWGQVVALHADAMLRKLEEDRRRGRG